MIENEEREKELNSPVNIAFVFLEEKLKAQQISLKKAVKMFDAKDKGV